MEEQTKRLSQLCANAKSTWLSLLISSLFVTLTLAGFNDIDFYGVDRYTTLPIINFDVPTRLFFTAAPCLMAAVYCYFHLYLVQIWEALDHFEGRISGKRLGEIVPPWLVTDAALHLRCIFRRDNSSDQHPLSWMNIFISGLLSWIAVPAIILLLWWEGLTARDMNISVFAFASFWISLLIGILSLLLLLLRSSGVKIRGFRNLIISCSFVLLLFIGIYFFWEFTLLKTGDRDPRATSDVQQIAEIDLTGEEIFRRPTGWLPAELAKEEFRRTMCGAVKSNYCEHPKFFYAWRAWMDYRLAEIRRPAWDNNKWERMDFRAGRLDSAFIAGAILYSPDFSFASLVETILVGSKVFYGKFRRTKLERAALSLSDLHFTQIIGTRGKPISLFQTQLQGTSFSGSLFRFVSFDGAHFDEFTDLRNVMFDDSVSLPAELRSKLGDLCQIPPPGAITEEVELMQHWRGWIEHSSNPHLNRMNVWKEVAPSEYSSIVPISPPPGCHWKVGSPTHDPSSAN